MLSTSKCFSLSKIKMRAFFDNPEHRRLSTFKFGRHLVRAKANCMPMHPITLSSLKFLQCFEISSKTYRGLYMPGIVIDSRSFQPLIAFRIPILFIRFHDTNTSRLTSGHLPQIHNKMQSSSNSIIQFLSWEAISTIKDVYYWKRDQYLKVVSINIKCMQKIYSDNLYN